MRVNQTKLADILGYSDVTIWEWQKEGMPIAKKGERGEANEYDSAAVVAWLIDRAVKKVQSESPKDRLARLQGDALELDIAQKNGTLVPFEQVEPAWRSRVLAAAAFMQGRASRLAGILETTAGIEAKREVLKREDLQFLTMLGEEGERIQQVLDELLDKVSSDEAETFLRRVAGHESEQGGPERRSEGGPEES